MWPKNKGRDGCRTPMVWDAVACHAGFSDAEVTWLPMMRGHIALAADQQTDDKQSLLNHYRSLLHWRGRSAILRQGTMALVSSDTRLLIWTVTYEGAGLICAFNFSPDTVPLPELAAQLAATKPIFADGDAGYENALAPYGYVILPFST